jgi:hypothetical protein
MSWRRAHTRYSQTAGATALASIIPPGLADGHTHILEAEELVAAIAAEGPSVGKQFLQWGRLGRIGIFLCNRGRGTDWGLQRR